MTIDNLGICFGIDDSNLETVHAFDTGMMLRYSANQRLRRDVTGRHNPNCWEEMSKAPLVPLAQ